MPLAKTLPPQAVRKQQVLLVDDHPMTRGGMRQIIEQEPDMAVCGECASAAETILFLRSTTPNIAILDISLADTNGIELIKDIRSMSPGVAMLVSSMHDESMYAERVIRAGAGGYISKEVPSTTFIAAIRQVLAGRIHLSPAVSSLLLHRIAEGDTPTIQSPIESLSDRELEVFQFIGKGMRTRDIAARLCLSIKTIETYREHIKFKLGISHGGELIRQAVQSQMNGSLSPAPKDAAVQ